jgi:hypothetical protein
LQTLLSLHRLAVATCATPVTGSQLSTVQLTPSSVTSGVPGWQSRTALQVSAPLHTLLSLHGVPFRTAAAVHPKAGLQLSVVHTLPSLQTSAVPAEHVPL